jgi:hypothetical protein
VATGDSTPLLGVYRFAGGEWTEVGRFETRLAFVGPGGGGGHFTVADVTGDGNDDILAFGIHGADHRGGSVLSGHGGSWHLVAFAAREYLERDYLRWERDVYISFPGREDPAAAARYGSVLNTRSNDCDPSCADGTIHQDHWRFDPTSGDFVSVTHHVWPETVPDRLYSAWQQGDRIEAARFAVEAVVDTLFASDPHDGDWDLYGACRDAARADAGTTCTAYVQSGRTLELVTGIVEGEPRVTEARFVTP